MGLAFTADAWVVRAFFANAVVIGTRPLYRIEADVTALVIEATLTTRTMVADATAEMMEATVTLDEMTATATFVSIHADIATSLNITGGFTADARVA